MVAGVQFKGSACVCTHTDNTYAPGRPIHPLPKRRLRSRLSKDACAAMFAPPQQPAMPLFYISYESYAGDSTAGSNGSSGFGSGHEVGDSAVDSSDDEENPITSISRGVGSASNPADDPPSSIDLHERTENTNNNKKRKIPANTNPGGSTGNNGMASNYGTAIHTSPGYSPRNRLKPSQRSPLTSITSTNHTSLRRPPRRYPPSPSPDPFTNNPHTPSSSSSSPSSVPPKSQFTFVWKSPIPSYTPPSPPGNASPTPTSAPNHYRSVHTVGTQTSPNPSTTPTPPTRRKTKPKKLSRRDQFAQAQRRRRQEALANASSNQEIWICEFCEYEAIFGEPPEALLQQYELKDRRAQRKLLDKQRLLEKGKMKGKKGKAPPKKKDVQSAPPPPPPSSGSSQGTQEGVVGGHTKPRGKSTMVQTEECERDRGGKGGGSTAGEAGGGRGGC